MTKGSSPHHIIAIGASAGGMEEINTFFDHTPLDGVAYIIIQHLSSDFKSRMAELLARHSKLEVLEAEDGLMVKTNLVYLIPNDKYMTIRDNRLYLTNKQKEDNHLPHLTINRFFNSLAANSGRKAIGIVLSGLGSDGTEGVRAIKKAGGMIIARNPETSEFASMPSHAIATGMVDFVLEPELMPNAIEDYIKYGAELTYDNEGDDKYLKEIIELIKEKSPLDFSDYKPSTILRRTKRRAAQHNFMTLGNYLEFLKTAPDEVDALTKDFLISVTSFFRDKEAFEFIQKSVLPDILHKLGPGEELKMWVAGCATGEEVYSLAILIAEQLKGKLKDTVVKIFATDIDSIALTQAGKGVYPATIEKAVSVHRLEKYFLKEANNYRVKPEIRKMVIFAQHDLVKNPPYCNMHLISCRNLLIYMTPILQKKIFTMLLFGLKMDGYLFLGSSENPMPIIKNLQVVNKKWKIYKNLETKRVVRFDAFSIPELFDIKRAPALAILEDSAKSASNTLAEAINASLITELEQLVVCVDEYNHVVKSYGDTTKYLLQKNFNPNLEELLPKALAVAFNLLRNEAMKTNKKASVSGINLKQGHAVIKVSLSVTPLITKKDTQKILMVIFSDDKPDDADGQENTVFDEKIYVDQYTRNLEEELKDLKDKLHSTYEQLDASNENMQSFNEELISANEEMQSTNEEMQSVNEELDTINADYQLKNKELLELNDDLNNYFKSNINGQLIINNELLLMKFSPGAVKQVNLLETDIGRPLSNITTNIKFESIIEDIKQVISKASVITKEIETNDGKWYQLMTMPYVQQADNKVHGAIITFNDITQLKKTQLELDKRNEGLLRINEDLDHFVKAASHDLLAPLGNIELSIDVMNQIPLAEPRLHDFLTIINTSIKKFSSLIKDIGTIANVENDMLAMEMVDMNDIINNVEWSLEGKIELSGAIIKRDLPVKRLRFSRKNMRSIVYNLVSNGIKFKRDVAPVIEISTKTSGDNVILTIQDNGMGMSKKEQDDIFKMYGRLHQDIEGHGIGLHLAKKIVDAAGGNIIVESEPGKGSKFMIFLKAETEVLA
ncbi:chemotaxis protein CheB [Mucilaginibacter ginsenosidivorans]|uniref:histidine kinase n=1 Tax=Mucilaginibacter ginsenosidivorans TaxID=398053 RepID=A0A5B8UYI5_9SPHI|nr:chemotaxis protein CheB [Mucilaginibacter ginsenosidivorans]QEC63411.1 chemotaxis protein CheR [Mucilaginibacter ginsenosidivorans]